VIALVALAGCPHPVPPEPEVSASERLERAARLPPAAAAVARAAVTVHTRDRTVSAQATLLVSPPDRLRLELAGPIGPAAVVVACDGTALRALVTGERAFYLEPDARVALAAVGATPADVVALVLGRLPALGAPDAAAGTAWTRGGDRVVASLHPDGHLATLRAERAGAPLLDVALGAGAAPSAWTVRLAGVGVSVESGEVRWTAAEPPDAAFVLAPPEGWAVRPMPWVPAVDGSPAASDVRGGMGN
jgi:hypothetical protein